MQVITPETIAGSEAHDTDGEGLVGIENANRFRFT